MRERERDEGGEEEELMMETKGVSHHSVVSPIQSELVFPCGFPPDRYITVFMVMAVPNQGFSPDFLSFPLPGPVWLSLNHFLGL